MFQEVSNKLELKKKKTKVNNIKIKNSNLKKKKIILKAVVAVEVSKNNGYFNFNKE